MSNLVDHAKRELLVAGYTPDAEDEMDRRLYHNTVAIVELFSRCGHSGGSAPIHADMIAKLLSYEPLGPITDNPDEWQHVGEDGFDGPTWQNRRDGRMFSHDRGHTYYSVDELRYGWRAKLFGRIGRKYNSLAWVATV